MKALAFDPGKHAGWAVADLAAAGARGVAVACGILDRGIADGRDERVAEGIDLIARHCPDLVLVETVDFVVARERFGADMAGHLVRAARLGGRLFQAAIDHGFEAQEVSAEEWRRALTGTGQPENKAIAEVIRLRYANWPAKSNNHERDAAGLALYGADRAMRRRAAR